nr:unnamed protein product [Callosobruchus analis]
MASRPKYTALFTFISQDPLRQSVFCF